MRDTLSKYKKFTMARKKGKEEEVIKTNRSSNKSGKVMLYIVRFGRRTITNCAIIYHRHHVRFVLAAGFFPSHFSRMCIIMCNVHSFIHCSHVFIFIIFIMIFTRIHFFYIHRCQFMYGESTDKETIAKLDYALENQLQDQFEIRLYKSCSKYAHVFIMIDHVQLILKIIFIIAMNFAANILCQ